MSVSTTKNEQAEAIDMLKRFLSPGDTVYVVGRGVAKSGTSRLIDLYAIESADRNAGGVGIHEEGCKRPCIQRITRWACRAVDCLHWSEKAEAARIHGCGMDMHFEAVYRLAWSVFGDPKALRKETL